MPEDKIKESLSESRRKEIFLALVEAQDQKIAVAQSRKLWPEVLPQLMNNCFHHL